MKRNTLPLHSLFALFSILGLALVPQTEAQIAPRGPDFNHDFFDDVAIGAPQENWNTLPEAGMVSIGYGSSTGLSIPGGFLSFLTQDTANVPDSVEQSDLFGGALAWGDFDGDCFDDLVVGSWGEDVSSQNYAGAIFVVYGTSTGLSGTGSQFLHRDSAGVAGVATESAWFGHTLAAGDFDGDGFDDVAVAAKNDTVGSDQNAGSVHIFYGSSAGLSTADDEIFTTSNLGLDADDYFGYALAAGDFDCDGKDDLAIGVPFADPDNVPNGGKVVVLYSDASGLSANGLQEFFQGHNGLGGVNEDWDYFGSVLATGNWNNDVSGGRDCMDLAVGVPAEHLDTIANAGAVHVIYGTSASGLQTSSPNDQFFTQAIPAIVDDSETLDEFGYALVSGRFNNDAFDDLAIGVPGENGTGAVAILKGSSSGLTTTGNVLWDQATAGISDSPEWNDEFGDTLGYVSKLDPDGSTLLIGAHYETILGETGSGYVHACTLDNPNSSSLVLVNEIGLEQNTFGGSSREVGDRFGDALLAPRKVAFRCPI